MASTHYNTTFDRPQFLPSRSAAFSTCICGLCCSLSLLLASLFVTHCHSRSSCGALLITTLTCSMSTTTERKADAFISKLAHSLANTATAISNQPLPTQSAITTQFEQAVQSLPPSKLRTHLLSNLPTYTTHLHHLYAQHLPTPPPTPIGVLLTREAFDVAVAGARGDVVLDGVLYESLVVCSNCPTTVLSRYFRLQLSGLPTTPLSLSALHRALSLHARVEALLAGLDACVEWVEIQLTQQMSPCEWLSNTIDRLTALFTMHARSIVDKSPDGTNAVLNRLCRLLLLGVVWRADEGSISAYVGYVTRTLAVWEQPPSPINMDAQLLFLCQWCALLHTDNHEEQASAAVSSSAWLAASRLPAILTAVLPAIVRALPLSSVNIRSVAFVRLAILHSILPSSTSDLLPSYLSSIAAMPLPPALASLWPSEGKAGRAGLVSVHQWVRRAKELVSERTLLQLLVALGAVGSEVEKAAKSDARGSINGQGITSAGQDEVEETSEGHGWIDDRRGDTHDALDGQLHSLIADMRDSTNKDDEEYVDSAVSAMLQQAGEDQPIAAEEQAVAEQSEQADDDVDDEQPSAMAATSAHQAEADHSHDHADVSTSLTEVSSTIDALPPPPVLSERANKKARTERNSVRVSPRHTRSGTKL